MQSPEDANQVVWSRVEQDFHVASTPGAFLGCIDRDGEGYAAHDAHTQLIGSYPTLDAAMSAVIAHSTEAASA
ncbi:hypothetical protein [Demequina sp. NBRC 110053]|uniref:hypothetical protein n=1 Tax=Demequina sp. NBRC 110053 TaxID=1570342 RepID=UPI000A05BC21|nr:hypothetical protein [Demequina sp. NBRC 110053]